MKYTRGGGTLGPVLGVTVSETRSLVIDYSYAFMHHFTVNLHLYLFPNVFPCEPVICLGSNHCPVLSEIVALSYTIPSFPRGSRA